MDNCLAALVEVPKLRFAYLIAGPHDLVVHVLVRDTQHLKDLAFDQFTNRLGVVRIETSIIYDVRQPPMGCAY